MSPARPAVCAVCCAAILTAQQPVVVDGTLATASAGADSPIPPLLVRLALSQRPPAGVAVPGDCFEPWFGQQPIGGKKVSVIVGRSKAGIDKPDLLCVDVDADGKIAAGERWALAAATEAPKVALEFAAGAARIPAAATFVPDDTEPAVDLVFARYLRAEVAIGGEQRVIAVADRDLDGQFDGQQDLWMLAAARPGADQRPTSIYELSLLGERRFEGGILVGIKVEAGNRIRVTCTKATGLDEHDAAAQRERAARVWKVRLDRERDAFSRERQLTAGRPRADKPVQWRYLTFDAAADLAKSQHTPLFVAVTSLASDWCHRLDYYTYVDKEVADLLNTRFVAVRIVEEQDPAYREALHTMHSTGVPTMGVFDGSGVLQRCIGGWKRPEEFVDELRAGLQGCGYLNR